MTAGSVDPGLDLSSLRRELREGVPHYRQGQHRAELEDPCTALLVYVDLMGYACVIPCARRRVEDRWRHMGLAWRMSANGVGPGWREVGRNYKLSPASLEALRRAEAAYTGART